MDPAFLVIPRSSNSDHRRME